MKLVKCIDNFGENDPYINIKLGGIYKVDSIYVQNQMWYYDVIVDGELSEGWYPWRFEDYNKLRYETR
jgi:hypothetical protein